MPTVSLFSVLIPYLELTSNQSYLVQRLRELAMDSFIGEYQWNQGGRFKVELTAFHLRFFLFPPHRHTDKAVTSNYLRAKSGMILCQQMLLLYYIVFVHIWMQNYLQIRKTNSYFDLKQLNFVYAA